MSAHNPFPASSIPSETARPQQEVVTTLLDSSAARQLEADATQRTSLPKAADAPLLFTCDRCGKQYKTRDSLTRHRHNHDNESQHVCSVCSLRFSRSDVLSRHFRIHQTGRKRSVRACQSCKVAKLKCDAGNPCSRCADADQSCVYETVAESRPDPPNRVEKNTARGRPTKPLNGDAAKRTTTSVTRRQIAGPVMASAAGPTYHDGLMAPAYVTQQWQPGNPYASDGNPGNSMAVAAYGGYADIGIMDYNMFKPSEIHVPYMVNDRFDLDMAQTGMYEMVTPYNPLHPETPPTAAWSPGISQLNMGRYSLNTIPMDSYLNSYRVAAPASSMQQKIIDDLVVFAFTGFPGTIHSEKERAECWQLMSLNIERAFLSSPSEESKEAGSHVLYHFVQLYLDNFHPLWLLFRMRDFNVEKLNPALLLILTATGAMYSGPGGRLYGSMMIERLFTALLTSEFFYEHSTNPSEEILILMLLTLISNLYFGPRRGFARSRVLCTIVLAQARELRLFTESSQWSPLEPGVGLSFAQFIHRETRKRIAFGIFRADFFVSLVLNIKPLISSDEMNRQLPCPEDIWSMGDETSWAAGGYLEAQNSKMLYSDLARIAMNRSQSMPFLTPIERDLILFATQESIWRLCHDPELFDRMTGSDVAGGSTGAETSRDSPDAPSLIASSEDLTTTMGGSEADLDNMVNKMSGLKVDYDRTVDSLNKWKESFVSSIARSQAPTRRDSLFNSRLLYHVSFIRLKADTVTIDMLASSLDDSPFCPSQSTIRRVYVWAHSPGAEIALSHALTIWSLMSKESAYWDVTKRSRFNILALMALYNAAMIVWAYAGTHEAPTGQALQKGASPSSNSAASSPSSSSRHLSICRANSRLLITCFVKLFTAITQGFSSHCSFAKTTELMAKIDCPTPATFSPDHVIVEADLRFEDEDDEGDVQYYGDFYDEAEKLGLKQEFESF